MSAHYRAQAQRNDQSQPSLLIDLFDLHSHAVQGTTPSALELAPLNQVRLSAACGSPRAPEDRDP